MTAWLYVCAAAALAAVAVIIWDRRRTARTMDALEQMLDEATGGRFRVSHYNETRLSGVESRMADYLAASESAAQDIESERDKIKTLISDIAHQTRTPIANVLLYAQLLSEQELPEQARECASALDEQARRLKSLIDALIKTSRLETGTLDLHPERSEVMALLSSSAAQFAPAAEEKGLSLTVRECEETAVFDVKWTREALCNLLDNAVKYTPAPGRVTLSVQAYELFCRVDVTDTGPGIPEQERPRIFQRFYRAENAWQSEGVGVGLYLARQIMEGQGGYVKVYSNVGQGSMFSLFLPRQSNQRPRSGL